MVYGGIVLNTEINMGLHHHHTINSKSYQPFSLFVGGVRSHQKKVSPCFMCIKSAIHAYFNLFATQENCEMHVTITLRLKFQFKVVNN